MNTLIKSPLSSDVLLDNLQAIRASVFEEFVVTERVTDLESIEIGHIILVDGDPRRSALSVVTDSPANGGEFWSRQHGIYERVSIDGFLKRGKRISINEQALYSEKTTPTITRDFGSLRFLVAVELLLAFTKGSMSVDLNWMFDNTDGINKSSSISSVFKGVDLDFKIDITKWDVSDVKFFNSMFSMCTLKFDISSWKIMKNAQISHMFNNCRYDGPLSVFEDMEYNDHNKMVFSGNEHRTELATLPWIIHEDILGFEDSYMGDGNEIEVLCGMNRLRLNN